MKSVFGNLTVEDLVEFGSYPQTEAKEKELADELIRACGKPSPRDSSPWIGYDNCWGSGYLCDFSYRGNRYRGVYTRAYKDDDPFYKITGYPKGRIYIFAYEPIVWRVLTTDGNSALLLSEKALDVQNFSNPIHKKTDGGTLPSNNYERSGLRAWLNGTFYRSAFSAEECARILPTAVNNGEDTTKKQPNPFACADTTDCVFLLSFREAATFFANNKERRKKATAYAKAQGCYAYATHDEKYDNTCWWLRSPDHNYENCVRCVGDGGGLGDGGFSTSNNPAEAAEAVAPAIVVQIS